MKQSSIAPRKKPQQDRAKATVDAIVIAAAYILERDGWPGFTTNRVAERAGVNIASLYQYFPNKTAIVEALRQSHIEECRQALIAASFEGDDPLVSMIRALIAAHRVAPGIHRRFTEELPRNIGVASAECLNDPTIQAISRRMVAHLPDPELSLFIARTAIHAVIHEATCHQPEMLAHSGFEAAAIRLARMLIAPSL